MSSTRNSIKLCHVSFVKSFLTLSSHDRYRHHACNAITHLRQYLHIGDVLPTLLRRCDLGPPQPTGRLREEVIGRRQGRRATASALLPVPLLRGSGAAAGRGVSDALADRLPCHRLHHAIKRRNDEHVRTRNDKYVIPKEDQDACHPCPPTKGRHSL